ncbi:aromatic peroxygenase [Colletotrichum spaethianum]|uniref:Aromatic peroxygenase n=1 Tax=Colletotrichum spaethianum TaxID=700344 RepID=A0AA37LG05_9PEZI|nr:aromatic peroxygenase [Colletotrichum spaethianum]GKT45870.1 aromatic peroxygenase [Colletotrichum spaethianum]
MKFQGALMASFAASAAAFPSMATKEDLENFLKRSPEPEANPEPQLISNLVGSLTNTISGLLGAVAQGALNPNDKRPEPGYEFKAPGPGDSRGPCPGLNLLANHGYLPRNGHVNLGQVIEATARGFNMGPDLSTILGVFAILGNGNITTESVYLGSGPGGVGGLNRHSTVEADISPNREDFYNGCGDNHHLSSRLFKQNVDIVAKSGTKQFDMTNMGTQYQQFSMFSQKNNPYLYYFPFPLIVSLGAFAFYPQFFSNGTYGLGGVANYESISSIIGAKYDGNTGDFQYVPETWPANWYRRATPYGAVQTLLDAFVAIYPRNIVVPAVAQLGTGNLNATTFLCDLYQGINSVVPLFVAGTTEEVAAASAWALSKLDPYLGNTALGCPTSVLSPNAPSLLFPNANNKGGPLNTPPSVAKNVGDNVYYKTYFSTAPVTPAC